MLKKLLKRGYQSLPVIRELHRISDFLWRIQNSLQFGATVDGARFFDIELKQHPRYQDLKRVNRFEFQICSQNGEDGIIHEIFKRIGITNRVFVELGVGDGSECNTAFLLSQGWRGSWIDGNDQMIETAKNWNDRNGASLEILCSYVTRENIQALFEKLNVPQDFDFLSLDIDQNTYYAWEGLRAYRPRVVAVEYNAIIPPDVDWKVPYEPARVFDKTNNYGASLKALEKLGKEFGYHLVGCDFSGVNAFFVRDDLTFDHFSMPFSAENHYEPPRFNLHLHQGAHRKSLLDKGSC